MRLAKANSLSEPRSLNLIYEGGITPEGATLESVDGYSPLDEAGNDLALKAAVFALFDDTLADDELQQDSLCAHAAASAAVLRLIGCSLPYRTAP